MMKPKKLMYLITMLIVAIFMGTLFYKDYVLYGIISGAVLFLLIIGQKQYYDLLEALGM